LQAAIGASPSRPHGREERRRIMADQLETIVAPSAIEMAMSIFEKFKERDHAALVRLGKALTVTTTGTARAGAVQIEPEYRTKIRSYVTEHRIRPVETRERIVAGSPVPREVELEAVPTEWGPSLTKYRYVYSGEHVTLVDPETRTVIQDVE
jgi:Protein of unknown function (DUF1236)